MRIISAIWGFISGLIATASGIISLLCNDIANALFETMSDIAKQLCITGLILLGIFIVVVSIIDFVAALQVNQRRHRLDPDSKQFIKFFSKWYRKSGTLSIICDDLDWVKTRTDRTIYNELLKKSKEQKLNLYLGRGFGSSIAEDLKAAGARVFRGPAGIIHAYTFSCRSAMGNSASSVIVRSKSKDDRGIVIFDEVQNTYVTGLLNALFENRGNERDYE